MKPMLELRHRVPGRMRWHASRLRQNPRLASQVVAVLAAEPGVHEARANTAGASLVLSFDPSVVTEACLAQRLQRLLQDRPTFTWREPEADTAGSRSTPVAAPSRLQVKTSARASDRRGWMEMLGLRPAIAPPEAPSLVCRLNLRLTRWMLRTSLRAWWHERHGEPETARAQQRSTQPRLGLAWAYQLSHPLLNGPVRAEAEFEHEPARQPWTSWWRRAAASALRL